MDYKIDRNNIHIQDSYKAGKRDIPGYLEVLLHYLPEDCEVGKRSVRSLSLEWYAHNFLFLIGVKPERTKSVDLNYPQTWKERIFYPILGVTGYLFID